MYLVLVVSKTLQGDGDHASAPYCYPEKYASNAEKQKLIDRARDDFSRLGSFRQVVQSEGHSRQYIRMDSHYAGVLLNFARGLYRIFHCIDIEQS